MMKRKDIIESGILERYLLGQTDRHEEATLLDAMRTDPELKAYFETLETSFEKLGHENAIIPPSQIKDKLLKSITLSSTKETKSDASKTNWTTSYFVIAASFAGLLFLGMYWMYSTLNSTKRQLQVVEQEKQSILEELGKVTDTLETTKKWFAILNSPNAKQYILTGNSLSPNAKVISYVNTVNKSVVINTEKLPPLSSDKDYQMWADVEGEMINMGLIETNKKLLAMTYIDNAESLNITIEPKGGNDHPTVSQLISNVYLKP